MTRTIHDRRGTDSTSRPTLSLCCVGAGGRGLSLYRHVERMRLAIRSAEARDLASVAERVMRERQASVRSPPGTSSSLHGAVRLAAALAYESACSLPSTLLWAGSQRIVTSLSRARVRSQISIAAIAKRWPGPKASVLTRGGPSLVAECLGGSLLPAVVGVCGLPSLARKAGRRVTGVTRLLPDQHVDRHRQRRTGQECVVHLRHTCPSV